MVCACEVYLSAKKASETRPVMAHTTSVYYRDRLGFEPDYEPHRQYASRGSAGAPVAGDRDGRRKVAAVGGEAKSAGSEPVDGVLVRGRGGHFVGTHVGNGRVEESMPGGVYEENLTKFKGTASDKVD